LKTGVSLLETYILRNHFVAAHTHFKKLIVADSVRYSGLSGARVHVFQRYAGLRDRACMRVEYSSQDGGGFKLSKTG